MAQSSASASHPRPYGSGQTRRAPSSGGRLRRGIPLGTLFGVKVTADYSLLVIAALVTMNLGAGLLPAWHPDWSPPLVWLVALVAAILFFASVLVHELSHALVGRRVGVPMSGITLFMFGGMAHMDREPERPLAEFLMAAVGPIVSIGIGVLATMGGLWASGGALDVEGVEGVRHVGPIATLLLWLGPINVVLGLFNLIPGFPLDGGRVLRSALWWATGSYRKATRWASLSGQGIAWLFIACGALMMFGQRVPFFGTGLVQGLWLALIGWFLNNAAKASLRQAIVTSALEGVPVARLMYRYVDAVDPRTSLSALVEHRLLHEKQRCFPVVEDGTLEGQICVKDVRQVPEAAWSVTPVSSVMTPLSRLSTLTPMDEAARALPLLTDQEIDQIPVVEGRSLVGVVRREDLLRWLSLHQDDAVRDAPSSRFDVTARR
jgi:Zn-dependent protease/CBS domain-containing protein